MITFEFDKKTLSEMKMKFQRYENLPIRLLKDLANRSVSVMKSQTLSGQKLKVRSGHLRNSIGYRVDESERVAVVGSGAMLGTARVKYANIHATGGTIRPKRARWLAIPLPGILQSSGALLRGNALSPRDFSNTFFYRSRSGNLMLAQKAKSGVRNLFVMKKSVRIPKRDYVSMTSDIVQREVGTIFANSVKKVEAGAV